MTKISKSKIDNQFANKTILITGGTGSLGQALTRRLLKSLVEMKISKLKWNLVLMITAYDF